MQPSQQRDSFESCSTQRNIYDVRNDAAIPLNGVDRQPPGDTLQDGRQIPGSQYAERLLALRERFTHGQPIPTALLGGLIRGILMPPFFIFYALPKGAMKLLVPKMAQLFNFMGETAKDLIPYLKNLIPKPTFSFKAVTKPLVHLQTQIVQLMKTLMEQAVRPFHALTATFTQQKEQFVALTKRCLEQVAHFQKEAMAALMRPVKQAQEMVQKTLALPVKFAQVVTQKLTETFQKVTETLSRPVQATKQALATVTEQVKQTFEKIVETLRPPIQKAKEVFIDRPIEWVQRQAETLFAKPYRKMKEQVEKVSNSVREKVHHVVQQAQTLTAQMLTPVIGLLDIRPLFQFEDKEMFLSLRQFLARLVQKKQKVEKAISRFIRSLARYPQRIKQFFKKHMAKGRARLHHITFQTRLYFKRQIPKLLIWLRMALAFLLLFLRYALYQAFNQADQLAQRLLRFAS